MKPFYYIFTVPGNPKGYTTRNFNSRPSKSYRNSVEFMKEVRKYARIAGVPLPLDSSFENQIIVKTKAYYKNRVHCDPENTRKAVVDALFYDESKKKRCSDKYVGGSHDPPLYSKESPRTVVVVRSYISLDNRFKNNYRALFKKRRFNNWTLVAPIGGGDGKGIIWHVKCSCGTRCNRDIASIINGASKSCGCGSKRNPTNLRDPSFIGQKFGRLEVIDIRETSPTKWTVRCECGTVKDIDANPVHDERTKSCGCLLREHGGDVVIHRRIFSQYKRSAKYRNHSFEIKFDDFIDLISDSCYYCGYRNSNTYEKNGRSVSYNGIDRVDSNIGYENENVVTCCRYCNFAKREFPVSEFQSWMNYLKGGTDDLRDSERDQKGRASQNRKDDSSTKKAKKKRASNRKPGKALRHRKTSRREKERV